MAGETLRNDNATLSMLQSQKANALKNAGGLQNNGNTKQLNKIAQAAEEFEAVFISEMMKPMFEELSTDGPFGGGKGEEIFRGMMLQEYGKMMAHNNGGIGLADAVKSEMIKLQEEMDNSL